MSIWVGGSTSSSASAAPKSGAWAIVSSVLPKRNTPSLPRMATVAPIGGGDGMSRVASSGSDSAS
eukprot:4754478-Lingulodinium_polyedra.AAC.1